ncbi:MAG TPA: SLC13 family permease [Tepidisphaeraceae bacterium]|nr:SLC13 family permease [Tepidisphaeraceae bacterium]
MGWEAWAAIGVVLFVLVALARDWAGTDLVLLAGMTALMTLSAFSDRFPSPRQMAAEFGNEGLLAVGVLFVIAAGLTETGGLSLLTARLLGRPRSIVGAQMRMMLPVAVSSAFLNNTPVVAMFVPVVNDWCKKAGISPSKLFIPLSYAAILGGMCTLIGTSTNLVVQGMMIAAQRTDPTMPRLGFWTIGAVGLPIAVVGLIYILLTSRWLLKDRLPASVQHGDPREYTVEMMVQPGSGIDGSTIEQAGLRNLPGCYLMEVQRNGETFAAVGPQQVLRGNDRLIFVGVVGSVVDLQKIRGLVPATDQVFKLSDPRHQRVLIEAVVSNTCPAVGRSIRDSRFRSQYDAAVIAVHRNGARIDRKIGDIVLQSGDTLLLEAHPRFHETHRNSRDFFLVSAVEDSQPRRHEKAWLALGILALMVVAMSLEKHFSVLNAALLAAGLMLLSGCCSPQAARRSIDWSTLLSIGAAFGIGRAMETTGAAGAIAQTMTEPLGGFGPWGALLAVYAVTLLFTELVTNNAAAALAFPIARAAAASLEASFMPFAICIAVAASAGFATPLGYQTHLMVYGPGGYRFSDFVRAGLPLDLIVMIVAVALTPMLFPF